MIVSMKETRRALAVCIVMAQVFGVGCASLPGDSSLRERIDESTGATVMTLDRPMAFFREQPMLAANGRDFVYIGPVEVNRSGRREYMLWAAYCSTIDRGRAGDFGVPERAWLMVDGVPLELDVADQPASRRARYDDWLYEPPAAGGERIQYRVTRAQLEVIAKAQNLSLIMDRDGDGTAELEPWRESMTDFEQFGRYLQGEPRSRMALADE